MDDDNVFKSLKVISNVIYKLYRKLAYLEYNNMVNSMEYEDTILNIKKYSLMEDALIEYSNSIYLCSLAQTDMMGENMPKHGVIHDTSYILSNKIRENDIVDMRISSKAAYVWSKSLNNKEFNFLYDVSNPLNDKYFLDILDSQINDINFKDYRRMLIDAKYDYAFINSKESIKTYEELSDEEKDDYCSFTINNLIEYAIKFSNLSSKSLIHKDNRRRLLLDTNYIRANAINMNDSELITLDLLLSIEDKIGDKDGLIVFKNIIDLIDEDNKNINPNFTLKRKY